MCGNACNAAIPRRCARWRRVLARVALALVVGAFAPRAGAQQCQHVSGADMVFTGYSPFGSGASATSTITFDCQKKVTDAWIGISFPRTMISAAGDTLPFELYQDAGRGSVWPEAAPRVRVQPDKNGSVPVYGFIPPQDAAAGAYQATVTVAIYADGQLIPSATGEMIVRTVVPSQCIIDPATLAFGTYDSLGAHATTPLDAQSAIRIACTRNTSYTVGLGTGNNPAGAVRQMANGAGRLQYQLFSDGGRSTVWSTVSTVAGTATSTAPVSLPLYGRVSAGQTPLVGGAYQDIVQSTINF